MGAIQHVGTDRRTPVLTGEDFPLPVKGAVLDDARDLLQLILTAVDELELSADTINLNTDELEAKLDALLVELQNKLAEGGSVNVANLPADYPLPAGQHADLAQEATLVVVRDKLGPVETVNASPGSSGDNTVHTPAAGKALRLKWIFVQLPAASSGTVNVTIKLGAEVVYGPWELSPKLRAMMHGTHKAGAPDAPLIVELSTGEAIRVSADVVEF